MTTIEFFKIPLGGEGVGLIIETMTMPDFLDLDAFVQWAKTAFPSRRDDRSILDWPDAVRACAHDGTELFRWTVRDQFLAGEPLAKPHRA
jgi:hypothetical protein